jgi:uncharacterized protein (TIGR02145 family)
MNNTQQLPPILDFDESSNKGTLFDTRDGQSYPVVKIGNQIWIAENFRYLPSIKDNGDLYENSMIPDNEYLEKGYGRLYDWNTAMNIAPEGWKLPSDKDFQELISFITKDNNLIRDNDKELEIYLRAMFAWEDNNCNDKYGFSVKPAGSFITISHEFLEVGKCAYLWSRNYYSTWALYRSVTDLYKFRNSTFVSNRDFEFSVRLILDLSV